MNLICPNEITRLKSIQNRNMHLACKIGDLNQLIWIMELDPITKCIINTSPLIQDSIFYGHLECFQYIINSILEVEWPYQIQIPVSGPNLDIIKYSYSQYGHIEYLERGSGSFLDPHLNWRYLNMDVLIYLHIQGMPWGENNPVMDSEEQWKYGYDHGAKWDY